MRLLIKYPTRTRKDKFFSTLDKYYSLASNLSNLFFLISLDENDPSMNNPEVLKKLDGYKNLKYYVGNSKSKIDAVNRDIEKYNLWEIVMIASDDMIPQVKGYDEIIIEKMKTHYPDTDGVVWFNDGNQKNKLNTLCILGKKYYERFNYVYHPDYKSCWSDNEFTEVSKILNKVKYFDITVIEHQHPDWGFGQRDYAHDENLKYFNYDNNLFQERKKNNFDLNL